MTAWARAQRPTARHPNCTVVCGDAVDLLPGDGSRSAAGPRHLGPVGQRMERPSRGRRRRRCSTTTPVGGDRAARRGRSNVTTRRLTLGAFGDLAVIDADPLRQCLVPVPGLGRAARLQGSAHWVEWGRWCRESIGDVDLADVWSERTTGLRSTSTAGLRRTAGQIMRWSRRRGSTSPRHAGTVWKVAAGVGGSLMSRVR